MHAYVNVYLILMSKCLSLICLFESVLWFETPTCCRSGVSHTLNPYHDRLVLFSNRQFNIIILSPRYTNWSIDSNSELFIPLKYMRESLFVLLSRIVLKTPLQSGGQTYAL